MKALKIFALILPLLSQAEAPEKIQPKTLLLKPVWWYETQAQNWKEVVKHSPSDPQAWFNYYASSQYSQKSKTELDAIVRDMNEKVPHSYESLVVSGWNGGFGAEAYQKLNQAFLQNPEKQEAYGLLQIFSEYNLEPNQRVKFSKALLGGSLVSQSLLNYSYNVLASLEPSSVLVTEGESATTPLFILQDVMGIRKDITILDLDLLADQSYLQRKLSVSDLAIGPVNTENLRNTLCSYLPTSNPEKKFYYALTVSKENLASIKQYLYVVGLASVHSLKNIDNIERIRKNIEKEFLLDYLLVDFNGESSSATGKVFSANYLVPLILLYESYQKEGNTTKMSEVKKLMEKISVDVGKADWLAGFLENRPTEGIPFYPNGVDIKSMEGKFRMISDKIYALESEVTNEQYNRFLEYLESHALKDLHEKYKFDLGALDEPALSFMKGYSSPRQTTRKDKFFTQYPAVNVSYEAAIAYCDWLTQQYNNSPDKKFKKVQFRLPSVDEWQIAAASVKNPSVWKLNEQTAEVKITPVGEEFGKNYEKKVVSLSDPEILYPWFRYFNFRNSPINNKGCYLGNFKVPDANTCPGIKKLKGISPDGFLAMSPVESYFPNDIGLFDVVGNVAEMTLEKGKACGGSWNHKPEESTIRSVNSYSKPDAAVGFRPFMEVIEK